jgi:phasin family protein
MTYDPKAYLDSLRDFGAKLNLPQVDLEKWLETCRTNLETLGEGAQLVAGNTLSLAEKQRETFEACLNEGVALASNFQANANPQDFLAKQQEYAQKIFDIAVQGARSSVESSQQTSNDVLALFRDRLKSIFPQV